MTLSNHCLSRMFFALSSALTLLAAVAVFFLSCGLLINDMAVCGASLLSIAVALAGAFWFGERSIDAELR